MTIHVSCQCGKQLAIKDEFAGKRVKCPGCGGPLVVPAPQPAGADDGISDLLDDVGMREGVMRCPGCGAELSTEAVLCVMCGFDLRKGHRIKARVGSAAEMDDEDLGDLPVHGVPQLDMAERAIARDKIEQKNLSKGAPWWMIMLAFLGVVGFSIGMVMMPQDQVMRNSGYVMMVAGILLNTWFWIKLVIEAFRESALQGILVLIVPLYALVYVFIRWDRVGGIFLFILLGAVMYWAGWGMVYLGPYFQGLGKDEPDYSLRMWQNQPAVVRVFHDTAVI